MSPSYRRVLALAVPALGALVAEPVFIMVDTAIVGRLGTTPLAGLSLAGAILGTTVYLCVFLTYATTAAVAQAFGAGRLDDAARRGTDVLWLAFGLGTGLAIALWAAARPLAALFGPDSAVLDQAVTYLRWSALGLPAMLVVLAATGVLRGLHNTKVTLRVAMAGGIVNAIGSLVLCYPAGLGIMGAALGTVLGQTVMALWAGGLVVAFARRQSVGLRPRWSGLGRVARSGVPLFLRTCALRACAMVALWVATGLGAAELAAQQVVTNIWSFSALAIDALAVAAQALVGSAIGAGDPTGLADVKRAVMRLSVFTGVALGAVFAALAWVWPWAFSDDPLVHRAAAIGLLVMALCMPLGAWAFALDGILMGAGDFVFLAKGMGVALLCYLPAALAIRLWAHGPGGIGWLWLAYAGLLMAARGLFYRKRAHAAGPAERVDA
ncbi:MAG: MATE family efflux transporter [Bifidobacteriaceae bacterium]|jgi:putative MATE family efflux protein|nr:MATE family efflux transporter [Bifidobacteriaceae bacterium]